MKTIGACIFLSPNQKEALILTPCNDAMVKMNLKAQKTIFLFF